MIAVITAVFVASLVGSLHCAGMCGGIVTLCVSGQPVTSRREWAPHAWYNFGRLVTYAALGAASGAVGAAIDIGGAALGWSRVATVVAGYAMILIGGAALLRTLGLRVACVSLPDGLQAPFRRGMTFARALPDAWRPLVVGLLTGLLPCGWLYAFVISAAGTGSPWLGALTMSVFWAGTLPVMLVLGVGVQKLAGPLRHQVPRLTAIALVAVGVVTVIGRLQVPAYASAPVSGVDPTVEVVEHVHAASATTPPCCHDDP